MKGRTMSPIIERLIALVPHIPSQKELDEAYINESVDLFDLERRMAEIDHRGAQPAYASYPLGGALH
jgi:hypothetical protein